MSSLRIITTRVPFWHRAMSFTFRFICSSLPILLGIVRLMNFTASLKHETYKHRLVNTAESVLRGLARRGRRNLTRDIVEDIYPSLS